MKKITLPQKTGTYVSLVIFGILLMTVITFAARGPLFSPSPVDIQNASRMEPTTGTTPEVTVSRPTGDWLGGLGIIEPASPELRLSTAAGGRIAIIHVQEGQFVEAGTTLLELESNVERALLAAAEADVLAAQASLSRSRQGLRPEDVAALTTDAQAASTRAQLSESVLGRLARAAEGGAVTEDELDRARRQAEADRLAASTAESRQRASVSGRREDVQVANAQLQSALARRDQARAMLERMIVVAPTAGEVLEIHYRVGEYYTPSGPSGAQAGEPLLVMGDTRTLRARIDIDERDVARLAAGAEVVVSADAFGERQFHGRVIQIARRMGRKNIRTDEPTERIDTKILEVVAELRDAAGVLIPGQRVMGYIMPSGGQQNAAARNQPPS